MTVWNITKRSCSAQKHVYILKDGLHCTLYIQLSQRQSCLLVLTGGEDDHFFSVMSPGRGTSDMESSISSNLSGVSSRTSSTTPSCKKTTSLLHIRLNIMETIQKPLIHIYNCFF